MLDEKTTQLIEKLGKASDKLDSTGSSQIKKKTQTTKTKHPAVGAGVGSGLGLILGHLAGGKYKNSKRVGATLLGALAGKQIGDLGTKTKVKNTEGVIKKQDKVKDGTAGIPRLDGKKSLEFNE